MDLSTDLSDRKKTKADGLRLTDIRLEFYGAEVIEKIVKPSGATSGRVYLPPGWIGKKVKIVRLD